jgi:spermidine synthase
MMGFDYVGALIGGLAFPHVLLPIHGLLGASFLVGIGNAVVALGIVWFFRKRLRWAKRLAFVCFAVIAVLGAGLFFDRPVERWIEKSLYEDPIVVMEQTPYQRVVVTKYRDDLRLYLDGSLQFSAADEYRYHEVLVHAAASRMDRIGSVLVLGGGDGLALRELRNYPEIDSLTLVDLDPAVVRLARDLPELRKLNRNAFDELSPTVVHDDAFTWVEKSEEKFDLIIVDLPDPHHESLAKLYSVTFYSAIRDRLSDRGVVIAQLGSPFFARNTFWTGVNTMERAGLVPRPLHVQVPSFGEWGFAIGGPGANEKPVRDYAGRYYDTQRDGRHFDFPRDMQPPGGLEPNTLMRPVIVERFRKDWRTWN